MSDDDLGPTSGLVERLRRIRRSWRMVRAGPGKAPDPVVAWWLDEIEFQERRAYVRGFYSGLAWGIAGTFLFLGLLFLLAFGGLRL